MSCGHHNCTCGPSDTGNPATHGRESLPRHPDQGAAEDTIQAGCCGGAGHGHGGHDREPSASDSASASRRW